MTMIKKFIGFCKDIYESEDINLHEPLIDDQEHEAVGQCLTECMVSTYGRQTALFEEHLSNSLDQALVFACNSGTSALHLALMAVGVKRNELVLTQPVSFVATCNAISYLGAEPVFIDVCEHRLSLSATALEQFIKEQTLVVGGECIHRKSGKRIAACVPVHIFGHCVDILPIVDLCKTHAIPVVEDAAEAMGSQYDNQPLGLFGDVGIVSFNGNKIITTGAGGAVITRNTQYHDFARHVGGTGRLPNFGFEHDVVGYNYRMPSINAALGLAQLSRLERLLQIKQRLAASYAQFFEPWQEEVRFITAPDGCQSNFWLNAVLLKDMQERNRFLEQTNENGIGTRPLWQLLSRLPMYNHCISDGTESAKALYNRLVCLPSGVTKSMFDA